MPGHTLSLSLASGSSGLGPGSGTAVMTGFGGVFGCSGSFMIPFGSAATSSLTASSSSFCRAACMRRV